MVHFPSNTERPDYLLDVGLLHTLITNTNWKKATCDKKKQRAICLVSKKNICANLLGLYVLEEITGV